MGENSSDVDVDAGCDREGGKEAEEEVGAGWFNGVDDEEIICWRPLRRGYLLIKSAIVPKAEAVASETLPTFPCGALSHGIKVGGAGTTASVG